MTDYNPPIRDMRFILQEFLQIEQYANLPGFSDVSADLIGAILEEGAKINAELIHPLNHSGDKEGCHFDNGEVTTPKGFKEAYKTFTEGGWTGLSFPEEYGGQGLPHALSVALSEMEDTANLGFAMYTGLTRGAIAALLAHASEQQKQTYVPNMVAGAWTGTMNLTEPHCGTDLGLMRTKADPQADGSYRITGTKIFISAGEHDLSDNIIHLVLARTPDGPPGIKGVSLFIVPKFLVNEDGSLGERNSLACGSIEEKMGIHCNSTCVMNYDGAVGYLLGQEHKGMKAMFTMMNAARIGVGVQGLGQSELSYQNAVTYAKDRLQGRSLSGPKYADKPADPIIVHPDIRRMLMDQKSFNEGARAALYWLALQGDIARHSSEEKDREKAEDYMALFTPVVKGYFTDRAFAHAVNAQQVYGGHGYIQEWGMDQFVRDARITMIYEGANGIQALDLVGRKLGANGGRAIMSFLTELGEYIQAHETNEALSDYVAALSKVKGQLDEAVGWLMQNGLSKPENAGAASMDFMHLMGICLLTYMWTQMAEHIHADGKAGGTDDPYYNAKLKTGHYYITRMVPEAATHLAKLTTGADAMMALDAEAF